jgi:hypothetical protein
VPRGTANTAERRLSSDCGPATPWWVWRTMGCTPRGTRTRRTNRAGKLRAPRWRGPSREATRSARERASPISIDLFKTHSVSSLSRMYQALRARAVRIRGRSRSECSDGTHTTRPDLSTYRLFKLRSSLSLVSRDARSSPSDMALCTSRLLSVLIRCRVPRIEARHSHAHNPRLQQQTRFAYCTFPAKNEHECTNVHS